MAIKSSNESSTDKYGSTILGFIVVLVLGIFLFNVFRGNTSENKPGEVGESGETSELTDAQADGKHTVAPGETLWDISEKEYGTGYNWSDIASANNLANPDTIEEGSELIIPDVTPIMLGDTVAGVTTVEPVQTTPAIGSTGTGEGLPSDVTVQPGDTLWKIAVIVYGDGYQWVRIAQANTIANPNIILPGQLLVIPQQ